MSKVSRRFNKVVAGVWSSERFRGLSDDGKIGHFYYMTSEHQTSAGAYRVQDGYAITDLGWDLERYQRMRAELIAADLIAFDLQASVVFVRRWFRHNPPMNPKHGMACRRLLDELESREIATVAIAELDEIEAENTPAESTKVSRELLATLGRRR